MKVCAAKFPAIFVNHGGGPMPLMGKQPDLVRHMKEAVTKYFPEAPKSIVVLSAHWESNVVSISSSPHPSMLYDYGGFPPETYKYQYPAPGSPELANKIHGLFEKQGISSRLDDKRGYDHGVFVPLMIMYPDATIPVVCVSLDASLSVDKNIKIGTALQNLREEGILILGSGFTFHNMGAFFNRSERLQNASVEFNSWLKETMTGGGSNTETQLLGWEKAPGARLCHPREEHLLPLFMTAAAAGWDSQAEVIYDSSDQLSGYAVSGYLFH
jgi:aromatic ring-opening dioxygenase catalytic subunit (LigB family)